MRQGRAQQREDEMLEGRRVSVEYQTVQARVKDKRQGALSTSGPFS